MDSKKALTRLAILQLAVAVILIVTITAVRFFDPKLYSEVTEVYKDYASYDTDISLVYDGK